MGDKSPKKKEEKKKKAEKSVIDPTSTTKAPLKKPKKTYQLRKIMLNKQEASANLGRCFLDWEIDYERKYT